MFAALAPVFAQVSTEPEPWNWGLFGWHLFNVLVYVVIGLAFFALAYLVIDKVTPFSLGKELLDKQNTSVAIVLAAVFIGIAMILASAIR